MSHLLESRLTPEQREECARNDALLIADANPRKDLTGQRFGRLVVTGVAGRRKGRVHWHVVCDCGGSKVSSQNTLQQGKAKSCGCLGREKAAENMRSLSYRHGMSNTPTHRSWLSMLHRCTNANAPAFPAYGGRGITVCERWRTFENFLADMGPRPEGTTLDRIDGAKGYEPGNCRWATSKEQGLNRTFVINVTHAGVTKCVHDWCKDLGLAKTPVYRRISNGMDPALALGLVDPTASSATAHGITRTGPAKVGGKHLSDAANEPSSLDVLPELVALNALECARLREVQHTDDWHRRNDARALDLQLNGSGVR